MKITKTMRDKQLNTNNTALGKKIFLNESDLDVICAALVAFDITMKRNNQKLLRRLINENEGLQNIAYFPNVLSN